MNRIWWTLPGPAEFVDNIVADVRSGRNSIIVSPAYMPDGLADKVKAKLEHDEWEWKLVELADAATTSPVDLIYAKLLPQVDAAQLRSARSIVRDNTTAGKVAWVSGINTENWKGWKKFLDEYQQACKAQPDQDYIVFCVVVPGEFILDLPNEDANLAHRPWRGTISSLDMMLYTASIFRNKRMPDLHRRLAIAVIAGLALWDPIVSDQLVDEPLERILQPEGLLKTLALERGWQLDAARHTWALGAKNSVDGVEKLHSAILARLEGSRQLTHRIWSAEVAVLLPFGEERRHEIVNAIADQLRGPFDSYNGVVYDVKDLEIGQIEYHMIQQRVGSPKLLRQVSDLKMIRNRLAHLECLPIEYIRLENLL